MAVAPDSSGCGSRGRRASHVETSRLATSRAGPVWQQAETKRSGVHIRLSAFFDSILNNGPHSSVMEPGRIVGALLPGGSILKLLFKRFSADQSGATAIEYALIAAGISLAIIAAVNGLGTTLNASYAAINTALK
jgi:pilus assembly protein Flp/PilA